MTKDKITLPPLPECDAYCGDCNQGEPMWTEEQMIAYAEMAVQQEREDCAKICDEVDKESQSQWPKRLATMIRARG
jgi:hypothetical protein